MEAPILLIVSAGFLISYIGWYSCVVIVIVFAQFVMNYVRENAGSEIGK